MALTALTSGGDPLLFIPEKLLKFLEEKVASIVKTEIQKILSVPELVDEINKEFETVKDFLKKIEAKAARADDQTKKLLRELRELTYKIEDALDEYKLINQLLTYQEMNYNNECSMGIWQFFHNGNIEIMRFKRNHHISCKIVSIKKAMEKIKGDAQTYEELIFNKIMEESDSESDNLEVQKGQGKKLHDPGFYPIYKDEEELVGLKKRKECIIQKLDLEKNKYGKGQYVLAVWGEQGVGKTTIARKVYEDENVRKYFSCYAWITATKPYKRADLLKCLFKQFIVSTARNDLIDSFSAQDVHNLKDDEGIITDRLRSYLTQNHQQKRYFVVLDNVNEMEELSNNIKAALDPSHSEGGRILLTTKSERIANYWKNSSIHSETHCLSVLPEKDAIELFNKKTFGKEGNCPWKLKNLRDAIVKECDGLPFLIEKASTVFSSTHEWIELYHNFQINPLSPRSRRMLMSSYHEMPYHLKPCFLYLFMFPEGYELERMRIVRLWIAEGFVEAKGHHNTSEEAAEGYINELVERGMVLVLETDETGRTRKFVLPHTNLPKLSDLSFCQVLPQNTFSTNNYYRRLSIHSNLEDTKLAPSVRSVLSFVRTEEFPITWPVPFQETSFRLKVLDLQDAEFNEIPWAIGNLHNLRYLCLRNTKVKVLPGECTYGLWNLETLDLKKTMITKLPNDLFYLHKLRHLLVCCYDGIGRVPVCIPERVLNNMTQLQKLVFVDASSNHIVPALRSLTQLRRLGIENLKTWQAKEFCEALGNMKELRSLSVKTNETDDEVLDLSYLNSPLQFLERLHLEGRLMRNELPKWTVKLKHLLRFRLRNSSFVNDPLAKLEVMQDLLVLELDDVYDGNVLDFGYIGFRKLQILRIRNFHNLEMIKAGENTLPQLQLAAYQSCPALKHNNIPIPFQIGNVLQEF